MTKSIIEIYEFILAKIELRVNARHDQTPAYGDDTASIGHFEPLGPVCHSPRQVRVSDGSGEI